MNLSDPVTVLPYVGEKYQKLLKKLGIETLEDLLHHYPSRHEDYSTTKSIASLVFGDRVTIIGTIVDFRTTITTRKQLNIQEVTLQDATGKIRLIWFNQPFLRESLKRGVTLNVAGTIEDDGGKLIMKNPEYEVGKGVSFQGVSFKGDSLIRRVHTGRLVPIYPETAGVSSKWLRSKIAMLLGMGPFGGKFSLLPQLREWLPFPTLKEHNLIGLHQAIRSIHFPGSLQEVDRARRRLSIDEILSMQLAALARKKRWQSRKHAEKIQIPQDSVKQFEDHLPFQLTNDQRRAIDEILNDLSKNIPMNRLLQGDVGSGKTVVAAAAAFAVIQSGFQVAFMAPTQILADQHAQTLNMFLEPLGVRIKLITGATAGSEKRKAKSEKTKQQIHVGKVDLLIGTHALLYHQSLDFLDPRRLALVIIDEQHRFGVSQRAELVSKGTRPHVLSMTATPIPRTVALTFFADLDMSMLSEKPLGRLPVKTWVVPELKRPAGYEWIKNQIKNGAQVFIVCPFIDPSEHDTVQTVKATTAEFKKLNEVFSGFRLAMLHGRMSARAKTDILSSMKYHEVDLVVTTPVVEVGVDVPDATIIVIEGAERFGLAQLHQLRGRVGRREKQSYCLLFATDVKGSTRLKPLETTSDGMTLAHMDLKRRGPGELWGTAQHGFPEAKLADMGDTARVLEAYRIAQQLSSLPAFRESIQSRIAAHLDNKVAPN